MSEQIIMQLHNITHAYDSSVHSYVLDDVSLSVSAGDIIMLRGESGSGKTTLLRIASLILDPTKGTIELGGEIAKTRKEKDRQREENIGILFQDYNLISHMSVMQNLLVIYNGADENRVSNLLEIFSLMRVKDTPCLKISGGESQRTALCRALINNPKILFADEPTSALDNKNTDIVLEQLSKVATEQKIAVVIASHDDRVQKIATRILDINNGKLQEVHIKKD